MEDAEIIYVAIRLPFQVWDICEGLKYIVFFLNLDDY